ncbi:MAG: FtsX-like permease family protein [Sphingobacteriia bacterium]|nr:FtsX-like permease family protein [Sphingobacteriia bacterium]
MKNELNRPIFTLRNIEKLPLVNFFQLLLESSRIALKAILGNRFRAFLTMLGISIGIFAITIIGTLVFSLEQSITKNLSALGNTVIYLHHWPWKDNSEDWFKFMNRPKMSFKDFTYLRTHLQGTDGICFEMTRSGQKIKSGKLGLENVVCKGVTQDYNRIYDLQFEQGRYFTSIELSAGRNVCIIGYNIAQELFGQNAIGNTIVIQGKVLQVVGVVERQGAGIFGDTFDDRIVIPYPLMSSLFNAQSRSGDRIITIRADAYENMPRLEDDIRGHLRAARGLKPAMEDNFAINKQEMLMTQLDSIFGALRMGGIFISILSVIVGGFGIANIMFVAVKERTHEIGIQKSLGATNGFILFQFLIESILLCIAGGITGILILFAAIGVADALLSWAKIDFQILISYRDLIGGLALSILIGILSGFSPSWIAARMDPVEAMRQRG